MEKNGRKSKIIDDVLKQEKEYSFSQFTHEDAFFVGKTIIDDVLNNKEKPVRIRITLNNDIIFQYLMEGKKGEEWLNKKQKSVEQFHHSSYYLYLLNQENHQYDDLKGDYAICGGGFPITVNNQVIGCICVSGLQHEQDHQLIIDSLQTLKDKQNV